MNFSSSDSGGAGAAFFFATFFVALSLPDFDVVIVSLLHRCATAARRAGRRGCPGPMRCCRVRAEENTSELQSLMRISYAVFSLNKTNNQHNTSDNNI